MAVTASPRFGLTRWSAGVDPFTRAQLDATHAAIDTLGAGFLSGTAAARPAATAVVAGFFYWATDTATLSYCPTGAAWQTIPVGGGAIQNSLVDAKGDLLTATANDTPARLPVGSDGQILVADSSQATGLKWIDKRWEKWDMTTALSGPANTVTETDLYSNSTFSITNLAAGAALRLRQTGIMNNDSGGAANLTLRVKFGATTIMTSPATAVADAGVASPNSRYWSLDLLLFQTAAAQQFVLVDFNVTTQVPDVSNTDLRPRDATVGMTGRGSGNVNPGGGVALKVTAQWSVANANIFMTSHAAMLELMRA